MTISKREFNSVAKKLAAIRPVENPGDTYEHSTRYSEGKLNGWKEAVEAIAEAFKEHNPLFHKETFIEACND